MGWGPVVWESTGIPFIRGSQESKPPGTKPPINHKLKNRPCLTETYKNTRKINIFLPSIFRALCYVCFKEGKLSTKTNMLDTTNYHTKSPHILYRNNSKATKKKHIKKHTILFLYIYSLSISRSKNSFLKNPAKKISSLLHLCCAWIWVDSSCQGLPGNCVEDPNLDPRGSETSCVSLIFSAPSCIRL